MPAIVDQLRNFATAISDPTRSMILAELDRVEEATATQLARRLGLTANNVYHHMRVLMQLGVLDPPRAVPGPTYVEKFYRITAETRAALRLDFAWYERTKGGLSLEDRKTVIVSVCLTLAHILRQRAREYESLDAEAVDRAASDQKLFLLSLNRVSRPQMESRLNALRAMMETEAREFAEDLEPRTDVMIMAALPLLVALTGDSGNQRAERFDTVVSPLRHS
jgi:DNA-binding transcriptional ArsR family regulator